MHKTHNALTPTCPPQPECFSPNPLLLRIRLLDILLFLFSPTLLELEVPRRPLLLATFMYELLTMFLECRHRVQRELLVLGDPVRGSRDYHGTHGLVCLCEVFHGTARDGDEVGFEVVGV